MIKTKELPDSTAREPKCLVYCEACGKYHCIPETETAVNGHSVMEQKYNWVLINKDLYCSNHVIQLIIDGKIDSKIIGG